MAKFSTGNRASGRARQLEIAAENKIAVEELTEQLIGGLGRPPIGGERVAAEVVAVTVVRARRLREQGRDDGDERRLLRQLLSYSPFGLKPAPPPEHLDPSPAGTFRVVTKGGDPATDEVTNG